MLRERMLPCGSREAVVTVSSYAGGVMAGCLQHPRLGRKETFWSLSQMILLVNGLLDLEGCPDPPPPLIRPEPDSGERIASLRIQILFREHHTWQGRLIWQDEKREFVFHSALELMQLMDEILAE